MSQDMVNAGKGATDFTTFSEAQSDFSAGHQTIGCPWDVHGMSMRCRCILQAWERYQQFAEYLHKQGNKSPFGFHKSGSLRCSPCQMDITDMT